VNVPSVISGVRIDYFVYLHVFTFLATSRISTTITNFEVVTSNLPKGTLGTGAFFIGSNNLSNKEMTIGNTNS
jgi:hypothetical protein